MSAPTIQTLKERVRSIVGNGPHPGIKIFDEASNELPFDDSLAKSGKDDS